MGSEEKLSEISKQLKDGIKPEPIIARTFIGWFGTQRRSSWNVSYIRSKLAKYQLATEPDFEYAWIDGYINVIRAPRKKTASENGMTPDVTKDPTYRIGKLASANKTLVSVKPDDTIKKAISLMLLHDYSQLPVMTSDRDVKGVINWTCLGSQLALGKECEHVRDCMVTHKEISYDTYIFSAVDEIIANQYVLIRNTANIICGIVTTSDLSLQFRQLGEPFLLLGEIENYIRRMIQDKYTLEELKAACDSPDSGKKIEGISDLTIGDYLHLLENPENWDKLHIEVDRTIFISKLEEIRQIRNDVMHFDPDGITHEDVEKLRDFVRFMQNLAKAGVV
jgi:CBS domain-containing protein